jgi:CheY-like chemotaxis protein
MKLPGMNGYEVIGRLKEDIRTQKIPLFIISAYDVDKERLDQVNYNQAFPVINKPFERDELREKIQQMLSV